DVGHSGVGRGDIAVVCRSAGGERNGGDQGAGAQGGDAGADRQAGDSHQGLLPKTAVTVTARTGAPQHHPDGTATSVGPNRLRSGPTSGYNLCARSAAEAVGQTVERTRGIGDRSGD